MRKENELRAHIEEWQKSGKKQSEWCKARGLKPGQMIYWRRKLGYMKQQEIQFTEINHKQAVSLEKDSSIAITIRAVQIEITETTDLELLSNIVKAITC